MLVKVHAVLSNLCKSYGKNSSNRRFLTIVAPMISYVFIEMDSAILCKKYGMLCVFAFHIHHCHLDLLDLLSLWAEATSWYLWLTYRIRCPVELNFVFLQIHQDSGFIGFWIGQWILCWLSVFLILVDLMGLHKPGGALPRARFQAICGPKLVDLFLPSTVPLQPSTRLTVAIHCYHGLNLVSESCHGLGQGRKRSRFSMPLRPLRSGHSRDRKPERFWFSTTTVSKRCKTQKVTNPHILFPGHTQD